jgi:hypothetical protein
MIDNPALYISFRLSSAFRMKLIYFDQFYFKISTEPPGIPL